MFSTIWEEIGKHMSQEENQQTASFTNINGDFF